MKGLKSLGLAVLTTATLGMAEAVAAERVLLKYRGFSRAVPTTDLATLAETGEAPESVEGLLNMAGQEPEGLRSLLTRELPADTILLDKALNSWPGEWVLDQLGEAIHPAAGGANRQALRSALVLSSTEDNSITLLEVMENYPTPEVVLEGDVIESTYSRLATFLNSIPVLF